MRHLTPVQQQLLKAVQQRTVVRSLLSLTADLGIDYRHAHRCINRLERCGAVRIARKRGHPLEISSDAHPENPMGVEIFPKSETRKQGGFDR